MIGWLVRWLVGWMIGWLDVWGVGAALPKSASILWGIV